MAGLSTDLINTLLENQEETFQSLQTIQKEKDNYSEPGSFEIKKYFKTKLGELYQGSCFDLLK